LKGSKTKFKKNLVKLTFTLIVLSLLASVSFATAQDDSTGQEPVISCNPSSGTPGTGITIIGYGWNSNTQVNIVMQGVTASGYVNQMAGRFTAYFTVPTNIPAGQYTVTATGEGGKTATTTFTVKAATPKPTSTVKPSTSSTPKPSTSGNPNPTGTAHPGVTDYPGFTYNPFQTFPPYAEESGFPTTEVAVIVVVVIAVAVVSVIMLQRRGGGKREPLLSEDEPVYRPGPSTQPPRYPGSPGYGQSPPRYSPSPYGQQLSRPPVGGSRYGQPSAYGQQFSRPPAARPTAYGSSPYGRTGGYTQSICPNCKRVVKEDYTRCPYCDKRLR
jgi:hypothetical protein